MSEPVLHSPAAHSLEECLKELKFGRPAAEQLIIDELINIVYARLGHNGPGFSKEIINEIFSKENEPHEICDRCNKGDILSVTTPHYVISTCDKYPNCKKYKGRR